MRNNRINWSIVISSLAMLVSITSVIIAYLKACSFLNYINGSPIAETVINAKFEAINTRFGDLYIWIGFFITLLIGVVILNWFNATNVAKSQAEKELSSLKKRFSDLEKSANLLETKYQKHENLLDIIEDQ